MGKRRMPGNMNCENIKEKRDLILHIKTEFAY